MTKLAKHRRRYAQQEIALANSLLEFGKQQSSDGKYFDLDSKFLNYINEDNYWLVSLLFSTDSLASQQFIFGNFTAGPYRGLTLRTDPASSSLYVGAPLWGLLPNITLKEGAIYHLCIVRDSNNLGKIDFYLNGKHISEVNEGSGWSDDPLPLRVGAGYQNSDNLEGKMGALKILNFGSITPSNIVSHIRNLTKNPYLLPEELHQYCVGEWDLNENLYERPDLGTIFQSLSFDGATQRGDAASDITLNGTSGEESSLSIWAYLEETPSTETFIGNSGAENTWVQILDSTQLRFFANNQLLLLWNNTGMTEIDQWYHIVITRSWNGSFIDNELWVNGVSKGVLTNTQDCNFNEIRSDHNLKLAEWAIWESHKLTSQEISDVYNSGIPTGVLGVTSVDPEHLYEMDDSTTLTNTGTAAVNNITLVDSPVVSDNNLESIRAIDTSKQYNYAKTFGTPASFNNTFDSDLAGWSQANDTYNNGWLWSSLNSGQAVPDFAQPLKSQGYRMHILAMTSMPKGPVRITIEITEEFNGSGVTGVPYTQANQNFAHVKNTMGNVTSVGTHSYLWDSEVEGALDYLMIWADKDNTAGAIGSVNMVGEPHSNSHATLNGWNNSEVNLDSSLAFSSDDKLDKIDIDNSIAGDTIPDDWAFAFWFKWPDQSQFTQNNDGDLFYLTSDIGVGNWQLRFKRSVSNANSFRLSRNLGGGSNNYIDHWAMTDDYLEEWIRGVITRIEDPENSSNYLYSWYINGKLSRATSLDKTIETPTVYGDDHNTVLGEGSIGTLAKLSEFMIIHDAVIIEDVEKDWNNGLGSTHLANNKTLKLHYDFQNPSAEAGGDNTAIVAPEITDLSGNGYHGTLVGFDKTGTDSNWVEGKASLSPPTKIKEFYKGVVDVNREIDPDSGVDSTRLPVIQNGLKFYNSGEFIKIPATTFTPDGSDGYTYVAVCELQAIEDYQNIFVWYDTSTDKGFTIRIDLISKGLNIIEYNNSTVYTWRLDNSDTLRYLSGIFILSAYTKVGEPPVVKINGITVTPYASSNIMWDYSDIGNAELTLGGYATGIQHLQGTMFYAGITKGDISSDHIKEMWNNGKPKMPNPAWEYEWELLLDLNKPVDPTGTAAIKDVSAEINTSGTEKTVLMEGYTADELDSTHEDYVFQPINDFR